jgi:hypothetical protein
MIAHTLTKRRLSVGQPQASRSRGTDRGQTLLLVRDLLALKTYMQRLRSVRLADGVRKDQSGQKMVIAFLPSPLNANAERCHLTARANPEPRGRQPLSGCESACTHRGDLLPKLFGHLTQNTK